MYSPKTNFFFSFSENVTDFYILICFEYFSINKLNSPKLSVISLKKRNVYHGASTLALIYFTE